MLLWRDRREYCEEQTGEFRQKAGQSSGETLNGDVKTRK